MKVEFPSALEIQCFLHPLERYPVLSLVSVVPRAAISIVQIALSILAGFVDLIIRCLTLGSGQLFHYFNHSEESPLTHFGWGFAGLAASVLGTVTLGVSSIFFRELYGVVSEPTSV